MSNLKLYEKKIKLRRLFVELLLEKKIFWREIFGLDLFKFFGKYEEVSLGYVQDFWKEYLANIEKFDSHTSLYANVPFCRSKCVHRPVKRGNKYSYCASST